MESQDLGLPGLKSMGGYVYLRYIRHDPEFNISDIDITLIEELIGNNDDIIICNIISQLIKENAYNIFQTYLPYFEKVLSLNMEKYFFISVYYQSKIFIKFFIDRGFDITIHDNLAIRLASVYHNNEEIISILINNGADIHADDDYALKISSKYTILENIKVLIEAGANIHAENDRAICEACKSQCDDKEHVIKYLIEFGADVNAINGYPLRCSVRYGYYNIVKILLDADANINKINSSDIIYLIQYAKFDDTLEIMQILKSHNFNFTMINESCPKNEKRDNIIEILIEAGVDFIELFRKILKSNVFT